MIKFKDKKYSIRCLSLSLYIILLPLANLEIGVIGSFLKYVAFIPIFVNILYLKELKKVKINIGQILLLLFTIIIFASNIYTLDTGITIGRFKTYTLCTILIILTTMFPYNRDEIKFLRKSMVLSGISTALCVILFSGTIDDGVRLTLGESSIFREDPNYLCGYFMYPIIYVIDRISNKNKLKLMQKELLIDIILVFVFTIIVFMTGSRGGVIGIIVGVVSYYILNMILNKKSLNYIFKMTFYFIGIIIIISIIINNLPIELQSRYSINAVIENHGTGRFDLWQTSIKMYLNSDIIKQILGYGAGVVRLISVGGYTLWNVVHNFWIEVLLELGIVGIIIIGLCYISFVKIAFIKKDVISSASLIGVIMMTMSLSLFAYKPLWNIFIIISLYNVQEDNQIQCSKYL